MHIFLPRCEMVVIVFRVIISIISCILVHFEQIKEVHGIFDMLLLSNEDRWMLYKYWLTKSLAALQKEIQERRKCYGKACDLINLSKREMFILFCLAVS
jgi:hypothetical protein